MNRTLLTCRYQVYLVAIARNIYCEVLKSEPLLQHAFMCLTRQQTLLNTEKTGGFLLSLDPVLTNTVHFESPTFYARRRLPAKLRHINRGL